MRNPKSHIIFEFFENCTVGRKTANHAVKYFSIYEYLKFGLDIVKFIYHRLKRYIL